MKIPIIETDRLRLRAHRVEDLADCVAMWSDPAIVRYTIANPSTEQRTWLRLLSYLGHWSVLGYGYWAVADKSSDRYIGELGFADFKRELTPSIKGIPELGWALASHAHGKGFATEALLAAVAWGDCHLPGTRTVCIISPSNVASLRVAEKLNFKETHRTTKNGEAEILFQRSKPAQAHSSIVHTQR
jgi:RimJ/RimL family protein N-acetyltransferase